MIDLHSHTTASDGQYPPEELLALAAAAGVTVLAVTDHDTVSGLARAEAAATLRGITLVNGIELSAFVDGRREVHVLGHFLDRDNPELGAFSHKLRGERERRMEAMVIRMQELGLPVTMDEVREIAQDAHLGRPHLARVLVEKRYCSSTKDAFDRFLGDGKPAAVDRFKLSAADAISLIHRAGGTATLAHPGTNRIERHDLEGLKALGLDGVEVYHSDHNPSVREKYLKAASVLDLVPTGGSDFHGEKVAPGRKLGSSSMPEANFEALCARRMLLTR